jgi:hypothetical protein
VQTAEKKPVAKPAEERKADDTTSNAEDASA